MLIESKSWAIDIPGSSALRPKFLGDEHKPFLEVAVLGLGWPCHWQPALSEYLVHTLACMCIKIRNPLLQRFASRLRI